MDWTIFWRQLILLTPQHCDVITADTVRAVLRPACYDDAAFDAHCPQWMRWTARWRAAVSSISNPSAATPADVMCGVSPRYVPREWLLARAYTGAEHVSDPAADG